MNNLRPHEVLIEVIDRIESLNDSVYDEIREENPRGFACSAALRHIRGIVLSIDRLDSKYKESIGLLDLSKTADDNGLGAGSEEEAFENIETNEDEKVEEESFRLFFGNGAPPVVPN